VEPRPIARAPSASDRCTGVAWGESVIECPSPLNVLKDIYQHWMLGQFSSVLVSYSVLLSYGGLYGETRGGHVLRLRQGPSVTMPYQALGRLADALGWLAATRRRSRTR
jgi:hypothetical protein